jgi:hypothetical protein
VVGDGDDLQAVGGGCVALGGGVGGVVGRALDVEVVAPARHLQPLEPHRRRPLAQLRERHVHPLPSKQHHLPHLLLPLFLQYYTRFFTIFIFYAPRQQPT